MQQKRLVAFVSALRQLETQQREAFLLHHCERLNARYSALAMDCSTEAADNHLKAADQSLRLVAGADFDALAKKLADAYAHLAPDPNAAVSEAAIKTGVARRKSRGATTGASR